MATDNRPETRLALAAARDARERVIPALQEHFAHDLLDVDEFERRVAVAQISEVAAEIDALIADLPPLQGAPAPAPAQRALVPAAEVRPSQTAFAIMSSTRRAGPWTVPRKMLVRGVMSSTILDFREARFPSGTVDVEVRAVMSSTEIIVPPGLAVETHGSAIMGSFDEVERAPAHPDPDAPLLRVHGLVVMGAVEIKMRLPGETGSDAWRRQKRELREARRDEQRLQRLERHRR
jgi:hypothetical protein